MLEQNNFDQADFFTDNMSFGATARSKKAFGTASNWTAMLKSVNNTGGGMKSTASQEFMSNTGY